MNKKALILVPTNTPYALDQVLIYFMTHLISLTVWNYMHGTIANQ